MLSTKDVPIVTDNERQVIVKDLINKVFIMWGDINNGDNIFVGDQAVSRYVSGSSPATGLIIVPFGTNTITTYVNAQKIFVDDSNFLYMVGKKGDILHVLICESETFKAIEYLISNLPKPDYSSITNLLNELIAKMPLKSGD